MQHRTRPGLSHSLLVSGLAVAALVALYVVLAWPPSGISPPADKSPEAAVKLGSPEADPWREVRADAVRALPKLVERLQSSLTKEDPWRPVWLARALGPRLSPGDRHALASLAPSALTPPVPALYAGHGQSLLPLAKAEAGLDVESEAAAPETQNALQVGLALDLNGLLLSRAPSPARRQRVERLAATARSTLRQHGRGRPLDSRDAVLAAALFRTLSLLSPNATANGERALGARIFQGVTHARRANNINEALNEALVLEALAARVHTTTASSAVKQVIAQRLQRVLDTGSAPATGADPAALTHTIRAVRYAKAALSAPSSAVNQR